LKLSRNKYSDTNNQKMRNEIFSVKNKLNHKGAILICLSLTKQTDILGLNYSIKLIKLYDAAEYHL